MGAISAWCSVLTVNPIVIYLTVVIGSIMNKLHSSEDELFFYSDAPLQSGFPNVLFLYLGNHMYLLKIVELLKEIIGIHTQTD